MKGNEISTTGWNHTDIEVNIHVQWFSRSDLDSNAIGLHPSSIAGIKLTDVFTVFINQEIKIAALHLIVVAEDGKFYAVTICPTTESAPVLVARTKMFLVGTGSRIAVDIGRLNTIITWTRTSDVSFVFIACSKIRVTSWTRSVVAVIIWHSPTAWTENTNMRLVFSTQLNFIDERIKKNNHWHRHKNKHKLNYSETDTSIKATTYSAKIYRN